MGLVYGEPGLGKTQTALWLACKYDGIYLRASNLMTGRWLLDGLIKEMDELPRYLTSDNFNLVVKKLKANPKVIFIDEIDAVARRRGTGMGGGHDEREQTLNQLLVEMDGFGVNEGIIVMAATNRKDILDPAILRPGRFDRNVIVGRPDVGGREEILKVHAKNKPLGDDVDLKQIAQTTAGFTGADLENLLNEAAIRAAKSDRGYIRLDDIRSSFVKVGIGAEKKSRIISEKEKKIAADKNLINDPLKSGPLSSLLKIY